jgi:RNA polymerase sigma factor (sigma-70 family)
MRTSELRIETPAPPDDSSLVAQARAGDRTAVDQLVLRYLDQVFDLTYRILGERDLAQDATQDTFVNALNGLHRFRGDASFRTWLLRIALNAARTLARRGTRRREVAFAPEQELVHEETDPATRATIRTEAERVAAALAKLPEKQRLAVTLRTYNGLSYLDIGKLLNSSEGAARVNYHLGVKRLREMLR